MAVADRPPAIASASQSADEVRAALAAVWASQAPETPEQVAAFYRTVSGDLLAADLDVFHADPGRQRWTDVLIHVVTSTQARQIVDIGCGAGHDLTALHNAIADPEVRLYGVEPNDNLRARINQELCICVADVEHAPIEDADVLSCFDVLEHVPDPESWLTSIATRAKLGCFLVETCATADCRTPLHLTENRGWHPGRALEGAGWEKIDVAGRLRVWQRMRTETRPRAAVVVCAYRSVSLPTTKALLKIAANTDGTDTRITLGGEAGIHRSRNIQASVWWRETADDVLLFVDDDIVFSPEQASQIIAHVRAGNDIVCAAYPVRDGGHLALRGNDIHDTITFGPDVPLQEIRHAATGFMAIHRRVFDAMIPTLPLCHANQEWAFWPAFDFEVIADADAGGSNYLSEDWLFCERAARLGFKVWVDPSIMLGHLGMIELNVRNMVQISQALRGG
jgi:SAM-dependent methyltransferase